MPGKFVSQAKPTIICGTEPNYLTSCDAFYESLAPDAGIEY